MAHNQSIDCARDKGTPTTAMNQFEELCKLASEENWCWKLFCTTCGHMHFRYAFSELAAGKSPTDSGWIIHGRNTRYSTRLGPLPRSYTEEQKEEISKICSKADLSSISSSCTFPDWLGYLGLVVDHMSSSGEPFKRLSESWALQLSRMVSKDSQLHYKLAEIAEGRGLLNIGDLESCEVEFRDRQEAPRDGGGASPPPAPVTSKDP